MPYRVNSIRERGVSPRKALGIRFPFGGSVDDGTVFKPTYETVNVYKSNLLNYFLTTKGERYLNPEFGNTLSRLLFSQQNLTEAAKTAIARSIEQDLYVYFPKLTVDQVTVEDYEDNSIQIIVKFTVTNTGISDELVIDYN